VALLLVGCLVAGGLLGLAPRRIRTWLLVVAAVLVAAFAFMPGTCVTAIAAATSDQLQQGWTSCETFYGASVPEWGALGGDGTGRMLHLTAAVLAVTALLVVRRRRQAAAG